MDPGACMFNSEVFNRSSQVDKGVMMRMSGVLGNGGASLATQRRRRETHHGATSGSWTSTGGATDDQGLLGSSRGPEGACSSSQGFKATARSRSQPALVANTNTLGSTWMHEPKLRGTKNCPAGHGHPATLGTWGFSSFRAA
eukprot:CAMPEP_0115306132 /NCGR_PEP_ID=MMETSP0270-20121206/72410_1 /TAXON_ID=71861 /ORGANISM="Scrippsiella trochoidea, Strain CCMP3099" /LENGTH=141 /DNA_ID=CAMNT_0002724419 /DNA_START=24 /DNA_END=445 /DNA_ORIENTATION=+